MQGSIGRPSRSIDQHERAGSLCPTEVALTLYGRRFIWYTDHKPPFSRPNPRYKVASELKKIDFETVYLKGADKRLAEPLRASRGEPLGALTCESHDAMRRDVQRISPCGSGENSRTALRREGATGERST
jgi:hypothetical protein